MKLFIVFNISRRNFFNSSLNGVIFLSTPEFSGKLHK